MARIPRVTRTIQTTKANVLFLDIEAQTTFNKEVIIPRTYKDNKSMMTAVEKAVSVQFDTEKVKPVHITDYVVEETLYGMSEQDFIAHAEILPPRSGEASDSETADDAPTQG